MECEQPETAQEKKKKKDLEEMEVSGGFTVQLFNKTIWNMLIFFLFEYSSIEMIFF